MNLNKNNLYLVIPYGIGDVVILCGLRKAIEAQYGHRTVFVIKPSHSIVMWMYQMEEYLTAAFDEEELHELAGQTDQPEAGKLFVAHPAYGNRQELNQAFLQHKIGFVDMFREFLHLGKGGKIEPPVRWPAITPELEGRLGTRDLSRIVLVAPEMRSASDVEKVQIQWYEKIMNKWEKAGYKVVVNMNDAHGTLADYCIEMSLEELIALAIRVPKVISSRSGFCDLIYTKVLSMEIIYPNAAFYDLFSMKQIYPMYNRLEVREYTFSIASELQNRGYQNTAIYGFGQVGKRIYYSLKKEGFPIKYLIDKSNVEEYGIRSYHVEDNLPETDVVLVTISLDEEDIKKRLNKKKKEVLFLKEIMRGGHYESDSAVLWNII